MVFSLSKLFTTVKPSVEPDRCVIDMGGSGDCGFRSIAAGIIDNAVSHPQLNSALLNKILNRHFQHFPQHRLALNKSASAHEMLMALVTKRTIVELVRTMAYTLRQLAVDEIEQHPNHYPGAFVSDGADKSTSPQEMRKEATWIDEGSIVALSVSLDLPVKVNAVADGKEIPRSKTFYGKAGENVVSNPRVVIQLNNGHYMPQVTSRNAARFKSSIGAKLLERVHPTVTKPVSNYVADEDMGAIMRIIDAEEKRINHVYESLCARLSTMYNEGDLSKDQLLNWYIQGISTDDYLSGRVLHVDRERGDNYFSDMIEKARAQKGPIHSPNNTCDQELVNELMSALARTVSVGSVERINGFFEQLEQHCGADEAVNRPRQ